MDYQIYFCVPNTAIKNTKKNINSLKTYLKCNIYIYFSIL